ncbi:MULTISPECIES: hypothetical protein [Sphingobacterium]|uniref:hypothetical protein n=1 Tax=Sphingobacterium TaxID=28453 RepID=UPI0013DBCF7E|nr:MULTISPECIES: hypothetical protein [unclassified Sphingobacterium]
MENSQKNKGKALVGALLLGLAVVGSAFTTKQHNKPVENPERQAQHFFRNEGTSKVSPVWKYIGTTAPSALDCSLNPNNYCYGSSDMGADASGNPLGSVTAEAEGNYTP